MYASEFNYHRPSSVQEAVQLLAANPGAHVIAGGHSLLPAMKLRLAQPSALIDIGRIAELKSISANGTLQIGALATHAEIARSSQVKSYCPALASAAGMIGDPQVRNFGTLGGNIAHSDPASDPPTVLVACDAVIHVQGKNGARSVKAADFFKDFFAADLNPGDIVTRIEVPNLSGKSSAYAKMSHPASRYALVGVCVVLDMNGSTCSAASVAVGGATVKAMRIPAAESALVGTSLDDAALDAAANALTGSLSDDVVMSDVVYPGAYRKQMAGVYLKRAVRAARG